MYIVFFGPPGAGKGTYSKILSQMLHLPVFATGDMFRAEIESESELGARIGKFVSAGELVPDDIVGEVIADVLSRDDAKNGAIFDGFPRTIAQAKMLDRILTNMGKKLKLVLELQAPDELIVRRLSNRRLCPKCGRIYNMISDPPKNDEICDDDGAKVFLRDDDKPETIRNRLKVYYRQTAPIIEYFKTIKNLLYVEIDTGGVPEVGKENMLRILRQHRILR